MKSLANYITEASEAKKPKVVDGKVKVVMICGYLDSNLSLTSGSNNVCLVWSPEDEKYAYITCNGGVKWDDPNTWYSKKDIKIKADWKQVEDTEFRYSHASTIGASKPKKVQIYVSEVDKKEIDKLYKQEGTKVNINARRYYASTSVESVIKDWKEKGYLD